MTPASASPAHPDDPGSSGSSGSPGGSGSPDPDGPGDPRALRGSGAPRPPGPSVGDACRATGPAAPATPTVSAALSDAADVPDELADLDRLDGLRGADDLAGLLGAEPPPSVVVRLRGGDELVAALPVLLGFHPSESVVLVGFGGRSTQRVGLTVRVDVPPPDDVDDVCADAVSALLTDTPTGAAVVVVGGGPHQRGGPPRPDVAAAAQRTLVEAGIEPFAVLWAAGTRAGRDWACYDLPGQHCRCRGEVPSAQPEALAAAAARRGRGVLPDRAAVADVLAAGGDRALRRRARLWARELDAMASPTGDGPGPDRSAEHRALLGRALSDAAACRLAVDDATVLGFCAAFTSAAIRDDAVRLCLGPDAPAAEQLWAALSRAMPSPERADPAALFAVCALLRGDGALAAIAVERALDARARHPVAAAVDAALRGFTGPTGLRRILERAYGRP